MQAASQLLILILGGLLLGQWLVNEQDWPDLTLVFMPIFGFVLGMLMLYKQSLIEMESGKVDSKNVPKTQEEQTE